MLNDILINTGRFIVLALIQVLILNNIHLGGYINPYLYVLFILLLPINTPKWLLLILCLFGGLVIDTFSNTMGLHAAACVFVGYCRPYLLKVMAPREGYVFDAKPNLSTMSLRWFFTYASIMVVLHHLVLFYLEIFRFSEFFGTLFRVILSSGLTISLILITEYMFYSDRFRR